MATVVSTIAVSLELDDRHFNAGMRRAASSMQSFANKGRRSADMTGTFNANSARLFHFSKLFGNSMGLMSVATTPVVLGLIEMGNHLGNLAKDIITTGATWEREFASVAKTVAATESELAVLEDDLRRLASWGPDSLSVGLKDAHSQIAQIAAVAGTLGLPVEDIAEFSAQISILAQNADDLTAENAARSLAQFGQITQFNFDQTSNLVAAVTELGNSFPTTEGRIVQMAQRLAAAGAQADMTEAEILGLAAALSSFGLRPELAGTNFSKFINTVQKSFMGFDGTIESASEKLLGFAEIAGMAADDFAEAWRTDAAAAITEFARGLSELDPTTQLQVLEDLELSGLRLGDVMRRIANNPELLARAIEASNRAFEENNAHIAEAERRLNTLDAQWNRFNNTLTEFKILGHEGIFEQGATNVLTGLNALADLTHFFIDPQIAVDPDAGEEVRSGLSGMMDNALKGTGLQQMADGSLSRDMQAEFTFTVPPGGTLWEVSQQTGMPVEDLLEMTGAKNVHEVRPGTYGGSVDFALNINVFDGSGGTGDIGPELPDAGEGISKGIFFDTTAEIPNAQAVLDGFAESASNAGQEITQLKVAVETLAVGLSLLGADKADARTLLMGIAEGMTALGGPLSVINLSLGGIPAKVFQAANSIGMLLQPLERLSNFSMTELLSPTGVAGAVSDMAKIPVGLELADNAVTQLFHDLFMESESGGVSMIPTGLSLSTDALPNFNLEVLDALSLLGGFKVFTNLALNFGAVGTLVEAIGILDLSTEYHIAVGAIEALKSLIGTIDIPVSFSLGSLGDIPADAGNWALDAINSIGSFNNPLTGGASGGNFPGGVPMIVGEHGPEVFVPGADGTLIPNTRLPRGGGESTTTVTNIFLDGSLIATHVNEHNRRMMR